MYENDLILLLFDWLKEEETGEHMSEWDGIK